MLERKQRILSRLGVTGRDLWQSRGKITTVIRVQTEIYAHHISQEVKQEPEVPACLHPFEEAREEGDLNRDRFQIGL